MNVDLDRRALLRTAGRIVRVDAPFVFGLALALFGVLSAVEYVIRHAIAGKGDEHLVLAVVLYPAANATLLGAVLYAGILDRLVGASLAGEGRRSFLALARSLPLGRLVVADLVVVGVATLGWDLLVVGGLAAFTLLALTGPVISMEDRSVWGGIVRSVRLVWPVFLTVVLLVTIPFAIEEALLHELDHYVFEQDGFWVFLAGNALVAAVIGAYFGVLAVTLTHELVARRPAP